MSKVQYAMYSKNDLKFTIKETRAKFWDYIEKTYFSSTEYADLQSLLEKLPTPSLHDNQSKLTLLIYTNQQTQYLVQYKVIKDQDKKEMLDFRHDQWELFTRQKTTESSKQKEKQTLKGFALQKVKIQMVKQRQLGSLNLNPIDYHLELLTKLFQKEKLKLSQMINQFKDRIEPSTRETEDFTIRRIKDKLALRQLQNMIQQGFSDKDQQALQQVSKKITENGIFIQTDCKVCFSSLDSDNNKVVYCDFCRSSFHQVCYQIQKICEEKFKCQACQQNDTKRICQICQKHGFPLKLIDNNLYHISCLLIFNYVRFLNKKLIFRQGIKLQTIMVDKVQNEINCFPCGMCYKELGMQLKCAYCNSSFHPICSYLSGCQFEIKIESNQLKVVTKCILNSEHFSREERLHQMYIRRYSTNWQNTINDSYQKFLQKMQKQSRQKQQKLSRHKEQLKYNLWYLKKK